MTDEGMSRLQKATATLETVVMMLDAADDNLKRAMKAGGLNKERLLDLREQVGKTRAAAEKTKMWALENVAREAGTAHPGGRKRTFGGRREKEDR